MGDELAHNRIFIPCWETQKCMQLLWKTGWYYLVKTKLLMLCDQTVPLLDTTGEMYDTNKTSNGIDSKSIHGRMAKNHVVKYYTTVKITDPQERRGPWMDLCTMWGKDQVSEDFVENESIHLKFKSKQVYLFKKDLHGAHYT